MIQFLTDYQERTRKDKERTRKDKERTRKGQGKDEKRTKGRKKDKGFIFI